MIARCGVERLMNRLGLRGVSRGQTTRTTIPGREADLSEDLAKREFQADAPNQLWVADIAYVNTWIGSTNVNSTNPLRPASAFQGDFIGRSWTCAKPG